MGEVQVDSFFEEFSVFDLDGCEVLIALVGVRARDSVFFEFGFEFFDVFF